jgi:biotin operon repressor
MKTNGNVIALTTPLPPHQCPWCKNIIPAPNQDENGLWTYQKLTPAPPVSSYGCSGQFANLGPSERRKGQWTRCAEVLRLHWIGGYKVKDMAVKLNMSSTKVSECITKLRRRGLLVNRELTATGLAECKRLWPQESLELHASNS